MSTVAASSSVCSETSTASRSQSGLKTGNLAAVGAGTGAPLFIALFVAVIMFLREKRSSQALAKEKSSLETQASTYKREIEQLGNRNANQNTIAFELYGARDPAELGPSKPAEPGSNSGTSMNHLTAS